MAGKDLGGFMKSFAGNLGDQLGGGFSPLGIMQGWNPITGMMGGLGKKDDPAEEPLNPGEKMFGMTKRPPQQGSNSFLEKFGGSMSDQLFRKAMMGFMNNGY